MELHSLFEPRGVAVIGASATEGKLGYEAMSNAVQYDGPVYPVNPSSDGELFGESFVSSVTDIDGPVDLALLCVPGPVVPHVLEECAESGVGAAVIFAGGFAEAGDDGAELQDAIIEIANANEIALLGPNTSGFVIPETKLYASFVSGIDEVTPGSVALIAQSGGVAHDVTFRATDEGYGIGAMIGLGNRANVGFVDVIEYLDEAAFCEAIALHIEGVPDARKLLETCDKLSTPVIAYKVGQAEVGDFAKSHTGALTGEYALYQAGFAQYGVLPADSTTELFDAALSHARNPVPQGANVGVITAQAGPGIIITDYLKRADVHLPALSDETMAAIEDVLPGITYVDNPVDTGRPMPEFGDVVRTVATDPSVDIVLVFVIFEQAVGYPVDTFIDIKESIQKPVVVGTQGPPAMMQDALAELKEANIPVYTSPERTAEAVISLARTGAAAYGGDAR